MATSDQVIWFLVQVLAVVGLTGLIVVVACLTFAVAKLFLEMSRE